MVRGERDALVADRAVRHEDHRVGVVLPQSAVQLRCMEFAGLRLAPVGRQTVEAGRQTTDAIRRDGFLERGKREIAVDVGGGGVLTVIGDVGDPQIRGIRSRPGINREIFGRCVVGRPGSLLTPAGLIRSGGGNQGDAAPCQRFWQMRQRNVFVLRPAIGRRVAERLVPAANPFEVGQRPTRTSRMGRDSPGDS